jgi:hypothetical protein
MKVWYLLAVVIVVGVAGLFAVNSSASSSAAQSCEDWGNETADRVAVARQLLYPRERQEQSTGSIQGDAQALFQLAQEQANSLAP